MSKRPTAYVILEELRLKGLVRKIPYAKKQLFEAKSAEEAVAESQERLDRTKAILPQLLAVTKLGPRPKTYLFEGINGITQALYLHLDKQANKELVGFYAKADGLPKELPLVFEKYNNKLRQLRIRSRGIIPDHPSLKKYRSYDKEFGRQMKVVPFNLFSSDNVVEVGEGFVKIISFRDLHAVIIESDSISHTFRQIFEMVWQASVG